MEDVAFDSEAFAEVQALEWDNRSSKRRYTEKLHVQGDYLEKRRAAMQKLANRGYTRDELEAYGYELPDTDAYGKQLKVSFDSRETFTKQLFTLARIEEDGSRTESEADMNFEILMRLYALDHSTMGVRATSLIRSLASHWKKQGEPERSEHDGYQPHTKPIVRIYPSFAWKMHLHGYIKVPWHKRFMETMPCYTINCTNNFPSKEVRSLNWFGSLFGFNSVEDVDSDGKNLFHHLFQSMKYSILAGEIAVQAFSPSAPKLPGDYSKAMRHKVTDGGIAGWTPLHTLCKDSDILLMAERTIEALLDNEIVTVKDFDDNWNDKVFVFYIPRALPFSFQAASPTALPSLNWGFTGTYA